MQFWCKSSKEGSSYIYIYIYIYYINVVYRCIYNKYCKLTNAPEKIRFQTKNIYSEERRKQLSYIQTVDNKAKISGPEQQLWKDVAAEAKNNLHNFVTQQPADGENSAETDWCQY